MHIGIDFGTSFTKMGYLKDGELVNLIYHGKVPTVACYVPARHQLYFGHLAQRIQEEDAVTANFFKLALKRNLDFHLGPFQLAEIVYQFFSFLYAEYVLPLGLSVEGLSLAVPNYFGLKARQLLREAAQFAFGVKQVIFWPEPVAAFWGHQAMFPEHRLSGEVLVADFGGGTCDFSFLTVSRQEEEILLENQMQTGTDVFSGSEIDRTVISNIFSPAFHIQTAATLPAALLNEHFSSGLDRHYYQRWLRWAEEAKIALSTKDQATFDFADFYYGHALHVTLDKELFHQQISPLLNRLQRYLRENLQPRAARLGIYENGLWHLDSLLLLGGTSLLPGLKEELTAFFPGIHLLTITDPDFHVLQGLCTPASHHHTCSRHVKSMYPFHFFIERLDAQQNHVLEKIPFDTENLELDMKQTYKLCSIPVDSAYNLAADPQGCSLRIYEVALDNLNPQLNNFMDQEVVLALDEPRAQLPDSIDVFLDLAQARLSLDNNDYQEPPIPQKDDVFKKAHLKQKAAFDLMANFKFLDENLMEDYEDHLSSLEQQPDIGIEDQMQTSFFKTMALLQLWTGKHKS